MKSFYKKPLFLAILINIIILALCLSIGFLRYGVKDDYFMAAILSGAHGNTYNPHLYFVNALYGYALLPLYHLFPKISWYYIGEMLGVFASFSMISYILQKKTGMQWGVLLSTLFIAVLCSDFYLEVQFTQCAAIFSAAGSLAILQGFAENNKKILIAGSALLLWGSLMRWEAFLMGMPFILLAAIPHVKQIKMSPPKVIFTLGILLFVIIGVRIFDKNLYTTPEYKTYSDFQGPRAIFGDGNYYDKKAVYKDLEKNGKSGENFFMLTHWKFYDTELFSADSLNELAKYVEKYRYPFNPNQLSIDLQVALSNSIETPECWIFLILAILVLMSNKKKIAYPCASFFIILAMLSYLLYIHRLVPRVENGIWTYAAILVIPQLQKLKTIPIPITIAALVIIFAGNVISLKSDVTASPFIKETNKKYRETYRNVVDYVNSNPDKIFFTSLTSYCAYDIHPPYEAEPIGNRKRVISYGYWTAYLPEIVETLKENHIENPLKNIVKDNVIVIGDSDLGPYLQRNYYDSVSVNLIHSIDNVKFYKYSIEKP